MSLTPPSEPQRFHRRGLLGAGTVALAAAMLGVPGTAASEPIRMSSRARYRLASDFATPAGQLAIVPWDQVDFQNGSDFTLQPGGKVLISTTGLYELVFSCDWDATKGTDIDLRKIGLRRQRAGQPDLPTTDHDRQGFLVIPGSDPPRMARYQGEWGSIKVPFGQVVTTEVIVSPAGVVGVGDVAMASHANIVDNAITARAVNALILQAKVIEADTVRVTLLNPLIREGISIPAGTLKVVAMNAARDRGSNGDAWQVLHSASVELQAGDRIYSMIEHKVDNTLLQATRSSFLQVDRLA